MKIMMVENILYRGKRVLVGNAVDMPEEVAQKFIDNNWAYPLEVAAAVEESAPVEKKKTATKRVKK